MLAKTLKSAPGVLVNKNWKEPFVSVGLVNVVAAMGRLTFTTLEVLGMPLTKRVMSAYPGVRLVNGTETKEFVDQLVTSKNIVWPPSMLCSWTRG